MTGSSITIEGIVDRAKSLFVAGAILLLLSGCSEKVGTEPPEDPTDDLVEGVLYDVAGISGQGGSGGDGGKALEALLHYPQDVTVTPSGEVYIVDFLNHCIRRVQSDGTITRFAGTGNQGDGLSGPADQIGLDRPTGVTVGPDNGLWLADWMNSKVKRIDLSSMTASTPIGSMAGFSGDGGPADQAKLDLPIAVVFTYNDYSQVFSFPIYISDQANQRIRMIDEQMIITTIAGSGAKGFSDGAGYQAQFSFPDGANPVPGGRITWSHHPDGLLVADTENHRLRYVLLETREVFTIAGNGTPGYSGDGGRASYAELNYPTDVLMTIDHEVFIADAYNHVVRKIDAVGYISTVVGTGVAGDSPNETIAGEAMLNTPSGLSWDEESRTLFIADTYNHQVKKVKLKR